MLSPNYNQQSISFPKWHIPYNEAVIVNNHLVFRPLNVHIIKGPPKPTHMCYISLVCRWPSVVPGSLSWLGGGRGGTGVKTSLPVRDGLTRHRVFANPTKKREGRSQSLTGVRGVKSTSEGDPEYSVARWLLIVTDIEMQQTMTFPQTGHFNQQVTKRIQSSIY